MTQSEKIEETKKHIERLEQDLKENPDDPNVKLSLWSFRNMYSQLIQTQT